MERLCTDFLNYLRSVLTPNYKEAGYDDFRDIMISCPRLVPYELMVIDFAVGLLEHIKAKQLPSVLDAAAIAKRKSYQEQVVLTWNLQAKQIVENQISQLLVLKELLLRVQTLDVDDLEGLAAALINKVKPHEEQVDEEVMYRRRMRMGRYFKDLRMNIVTLRDSKKAREPKEGSAKKPKKAAGKKKATK